MALLNDPAKDFDMLLYQTGIKLKEIAAAVGRDPSNLRATVHSRVINNRYVETVDRLGYDIKITYVRKERKR